MFSHPLISVNIQDQRSIYWNMSLGRPSRLARDGTAGVLPGRQAPSQMKGVLHAHPNHGVDGQHRIKLSNDPNFVDKLRDVVGLYVDPPAHAIVLSLDEKSQIQALDRTGRACR